MTNPFRAAAGRLRAEVSHPETIDPAGAEIGADLFEPAATLWDRLGKLPHKAEAILAQRRLEEAVYWAARAAGKTWD